jgi:polyphosphate kinase
MASPLDEGLATRAHEGEASDAAAKPPEFLNRELTWLEFNRRVLHEALDPRTPLLERVRFLGIFTSNLDEFFMKRVGGLKRQVAAGIRSRSPDGLTPAEQLAAIRRLLTPMLLDQARAYREDIVPALAVHGIRLLARADLTDADRRAAHEYFRTQVFPVLTPLAVDPGHPFPFISNLSTSLAVTLRHPYREERLFARVKVPGVLPAWVRLPATAGEEHRFVRLMDVILENMNDLFPDMEPLGAMSFRITRNADIERDEEDAEDLLELIEQELRQRRFEKVVRLEHGPDPDPWILRYLMTELDLEADDVFEMPALMDYRGLSVVADLNVPELRYEPYTPVVLPPLADDQADIFALIRQGDILVHQPYESFAASVERFVRAAADDPDVLAIKMTVYRTGAESPFIHTLIRAAERGKQVACLVELKARFDEERNILWAQALEKAGVHVVYGIVGLKTHTKTTLVVRREAEGLRCYAHIGTGNYHMQTARLYTDLSLLTCRPDLTDDLVDLFNYLTGRSLKGASRRLLVAPINMKDRFLGLIEGEIEHARAGRRGRIIAKMNSLEDRSICRALYAASAAGVSIDLIVRGFCCLRPGVAGLSENIRVISVVGRFLEHSRIFYFGGGAEDPLDGEFFIGSADWMYRNLLARVEAVTPVDGRLLRAKLWEILSLLLADQRQAWDMQPDGTYVQRRPAPDAGGPEAVGTHQALMTLARRSAGIQPPPDS